MKKKDVLKLYKYQQSYGCNSYHCNCLYCASNPKYLEKKVDSSNDELLIDDEIICPDLSPLLTHPEIYEQILIFQDFISKLENDDNCQLNDITDIMKDPNVIAHILIFDDNVFDKDDLVLNDLECDKFRKLLFNHAEQLSALSNSYFELLSRMERYDRKRTFHFLRALIIATLFHNYLVYEKAFMTLIELILTLPDQEIFFRLFAGLHYVFESFVFLVNSNLSTYILSHKKIDAAIIKMCELLQLLCNANKFLPPSFFVNDLFSALVTDYESKIEMMRFKNVITLECRRSMMIEAECFHNTSLLMKIKRDDIINCSMRFVALPCDLLKKKIKIEFVGESGYDLGGVSNEFFNVISKRLVDSDFIVKMENGRFWFKNKKSSSLVLLGLIVGLALLNQSVLPISFPDLLYKKLLKKQITIDDVSEIRPDVVNGLKSLQKIDNIEDADLRFTVTSEVDGMYKDVELVPSGSDIIVNKENLDYYVDLMVNWISYEEIKKAYDDFEEGFLSVINFKLDNWFDAQELNNIISGVKKYNWDEIKATTIYEGYNSVSTTVKQFWKIFDNFTYEQKLRLMFFITGREPASSDGSQTIKIKIARSDSTYLLPTSHTCFSMLVLPDYHNEMKLKRFLKICIENAEGFGIK